MKYRAVSRFALLASLLGPFVAGCASTPTQESTGQFIDSSVITTKVKTKLFEDPLTRGFTISVKTFKGVVQLSGFIKNEQEKQRADAITRSVAGVKRVIDDLVVKPS